MIISMKKGAPEQEVGKLIHSFEDMGLSVTMISGDNYNVFGLVGDTTLVDEAQIAVNPYVDAITRVSAPYKKVNRLFHPEDSVIDCGGVKIGGQEKIAVIAGPCSVEGLDPLLEDARAVKAAGATMLRGGAYKPRTSPYAFQGLGTEGIMDLVEARKETGLPIVSELMAIEHLDEFVENVDLIQVGARNMQNFDLLKALGHTNKPVLLKRGLANTMEEWLMSAESARLKNTPATRWIFPSCRSSRKRPICPSSSTLPMPRATGGWWSPCRWRRSRQALTASSSRCIRIRKPHGRTALSR